MRQQQRPTEDEIFRVAYEIPSPDARITYLKQVCRDSVEVERIIDLLKEGSPDESFLEKGPVGLVETTDIPVPLDMSGESIGPYKLLQPIGEGGFGVVYMAEQISPVRRKVALKVIKPGMDTKQVVARFEAERQALALMDHPNVARVFDGGTTEAGRPYFVMELVKGVPITTFCDEKKLDVHKRLDLFCTVCKAIQHAHHKGVIHRDIKPSNVLVTLHDGKPVPKVIDFGVAKAMSQQLTEKTMFTAHGQMIGTVQYMSPEQAEMSGLDIDTRSDIYSLGVLLYELLTGDPPLDLKRIQQTALAEMHRLIRDQDAQKPSNRVSTLGDRLSVVAEQRSMDPQRLGRFLRGDLDWIVMKAIEKDRNRRYETASNFAIDVERFLQNEPVEACPPSLAYKASKFVRRNRGPVLAGSLIALSLVLGIIGTTTGWLQARRDAINARESEEKERDAKILAVEAEGRQRTARARAEKAEQDLQQQSYIQLVRLAHKEMQDGRPAAAIGLLADCKPKELRQWEWRYLKRLACSDRLKSMQFDLPGTVLSAEWSPREPNLAVALTDDGSLTRLTLKNDTTEYRSLGKLKIRTEYDFWASYDIAFSHTGDEVAVLTADGFALVDLKSGQLLLERQGYWTQLAFHPKRHHLATAHTNGLIHIWDTRKEKKIREFSTPGACEMKYSPDGRWVAVSDPNRVHVYSAENGEHERTFLSHYGPPFALAFSEDSTRLASGGGGQKIVIRNIATGEEEQMLSGHTADVTGISFGSNRIVSADADGSLRIWDIRSGKEVFATKRLTNHLKQPSFNESGMRILATDRNKRLTVWDATPDATQKRPKRSFDTGRRVFDLAFLDDTGNRIASVGEGTLGEADSELSGLRLWDVVNGRPESVARKTAISLNLAFNRDRNWIATAHFEAGGGLLIWDQRTGELLQNPECTEGAISVAISPNGSWIAISDQNQVSAWELPGEINEESRIELGSVRGLGDELKFSPCGKYLVGGRGNELRLWNVDQFRTSAQSRVIAKSTSKIGIIGMRFSVSPDGKHVAYGNQDGDVVIVSTQGDDEQTTPLASWKASDFPLGCVAYSPDGRYLASGGADETIRIWDANTKTLVNTFIDKESVFCLVFSSDCRSLASGGHGKKVKVWDTSFLTE